MKNFREIYSVWDSFINEAKFKDFDKLIIDGEIPEEVINTSVIVTKGNGQKKWVKPFNDPIFSDILVNTIKAGSFNSIEDFISSYEDYKKFYDRIRSSESKSVTIYRKDFDIETLKTLTIDQIKIIARNDDLYSYSGSSSRYEKILSTRDANHITIVYEDEKTMLAVPTTTSGSIALARSYFDQEGNWRYDEVVNGKGKVIGRMSWCTSITGQNNMFNNYITGTFNTFVYYTSKDMTKFANNDKFRKVCFCWEQDDDSPNQVKISKDSHKFVDADNNPVTESDENGFSFLRKIAGQSAVDVTKEFLGTDERFTKLTKDILEVLYSGNVSKIKRMLSIIFSPTIKALQTIVKNKNAEQFDYDALFSELESKTIEHLTFPRAVVNSDAYFYLLKYYRGSYVNITPCKTPPTKKAEDDIVEYIESKSASNDIGAKEEKIIIGFSRFKSVMDRLNLRKPAIDFFEKLSISASRRKISLDAKRDSIDSKLFPVYYILLTKYENIKYKKSIVYTLYSFKYELTDSLISKLKENSKVLFDSDEEKSMFVNKYYTAAAINIKDSSNERLRNISYFSTILGQESLNIHANVMKENVRTKSKNNLEIYVYMIAFSIFENAIKSSDDRSMSMYNYIIKQAKLVDKNVLIGKSRNLIRRINDNNIDFNLSAQFTNAFIRFLETTPDDEIFSSGLIVLVHFFFMCKGELGAKCTAIINRFNDTQQNVM
jgi:hypothetical protein